VRSQSTWLGLRNIPCLGLEQSEYLDGILDDDEISGYSSNEESSECDDYMELVFPGTHEISNNDDADDIVKHDDGQM
jgi:hypothetical protein